MFFPLKHFKLHDFPESQASFKNTYETLHHDSGLDSVLLVLLVMTFTYGHQLAILHHHRAARSVLFGAPGTGSLRGDSRGAR